MHFGEAVLVAAHLSVSSKEWTVPYSKWVKSIMHIHGVPQGFSECWFIGPLVNKNTEVRLTKIWGQNV